MNISLAQTTTTTSTQEKARDPRLADAAHEFESMMLQELLKPLRSGEANEDGDSERDTSFDTLSSYGTEAVATAISKSGGLGIARQIIDRLSTLK